MSPSPRERQASGEKAHAQALTDRVLRPVPRSLLLPQPREEVLSSTVVYR